MFQWKCGFNSLFSSWQESDRKKFGALSFLFTVVCLSWDFTRYVSLFISGWLITLLPRCWVSDSTTLINILKVRDQKCALFTTITKAFLNVEHNFLDKLCFLQITRSVCYGVRTRSFALHRAQDADDCALAFCYHLKVSFTSRATHVHKQSVSSE